jgi:hypothetical protein
LGTGMAIVSRLAEVGASVIDPAIRSRWIKSS